jgi:hypothetical protein
MTSPCWWLPFPMGTTWFSRHSMFTGDSATRGGRTMSEGTAVRPATSNLDPARSMNSLTSAGYSAAVLFIASAMASTTTLTTNSPVSLMLARVSFRLCRWSPA